MGAKTQPDRSTPCTTSAPFAKILPLLTPPLRAAPMSSEVLALDEARRARITAAETAQAEQNRASKDVGAAKASGNEAEFERLRALVAEKKAEVAAMQAEAKDLDQQLTDLLLTLPNSPLAEVPQGADETENVERNRWSTPRTLDFKALEHFAGLDLPYPAPQTTGAPPAVLARWRRAQFPACPVFSHQPAAS